MSGRAGWRDGMETRQTRRQESMQMFHSDVSFPFSGVTLRSRQTWRAWQTEDSGASDVGDGTFAVFLQRDFYVGSGNVALLPALLPRPRPPVAFVLLDDVQHLRAGRQSGRHVLPRLTGDEFSNCTIQIKLKSLTSSSAITSVPSFWPESQTKTGHLDHIRLDSL